MELKAMSWYVQLSLHQSSNIDSYTIRICRYWKETNCEHSLVTLLPLLPPPLVITTTTSWNLHSIMFLVKHYHSLWWRGKEQYQHKIKSSRSNVGLFKDKETRYEFENYDDSNRNIHNNTYGKNEKFHRTRERAGNWLSSWHTTYGGKWVPFEWYGNTIREQHSIYTPVFIECNIT